MSAAPNLQPRWGELTIDGLDQLELAYATKLLTLQSTQGLSATAHLGGNPGLLVRQLIAHARWALLARAWADTHPRQQGGTAIRAADALILGVTPAEHRK